MPIELAWVERNKEELVVIRAAYDSAGQTFTMQTPRGLVTLVISALGERTLSDAEVLMTVASSLADAGLPSNLN